MLSSPKRAIIRIPLVENFFPFVSRGLKCFFGSSIVTNNKVTDQATEAFQHFAVFQNIPERHLCTLHNQLINLLPHNYMMCLPLHKGHSYCKGHCIRYIRYKPCRYICSSVNILFLASIKLSTSAFITSVVEEFSGKLK